MAFSLKDIKLGGLIIEPSSPRSYRTRFQQDKPIPDKVDLRSKCTPVENQGQIGSCTANAAVGALEYHFICRDGHSPDLSRMFVYFNSRRLQGDIQTDSGATIPQAMASVLAYGACQEQIWPYDPQLFAQLPTQQAYADAKQFEAVQYARVEGQKARLSALAEGLPIVFGIWLPERCYKEAATTGVIPQLTEEEKRAAPAGGHAMLIVGYDRHEQMYIVRNSWGINYGDRGYLRIPFNIMEENSAPDQFWVIARLEEAGNFSLIKPDLESSNSVSRLPEMRTGGMAETAKKMREDIRSSISADLSASSKKLDSLLSKSSRENVTQSSGKFGDACFMCNGSGSCFYCNGSGSYAPGQPCANCVGRGVCSSCNGAGNI
jgi:hypothetical protein